MTNNQEKLIFPQANSPTLTIDSHTPSEGYTSTYRATYFDNIHHNAKPNNYNLTVDPIDSTSITSVDMNITVYNDKTGAIVEDGTGATLTDLNTNVSAQGAVLDLTTKNVFIDQVYINVLGILSSTTITGQIWNATLRASDGKVIPHKRLAIGSRTVSPTTGFVGIPMNAGTTISNSSTYTNATGSYIFFVINGSSTSWFLNGDDSDGVDDGPTFISNGIPSTEDGWGNYTDFDFAIQYNFSAVFRPSLIDLKVATPSQPSGINTQPSGRFIDNETYTTSTVYRIFYNESLVSGLPKLNITYLSERVEHGLSSISVDTLPESSSVNWTVTYDSPFSRSDSNVSQSLSIPGSHTVISGTFNGTVLNQGTDFTVENSGLNQTITFNKGKGTYVFVLQSTNILLTETLQTYVEKTGTWIANDTGVLGVIHPSATVGDHVNATVLSSLSGIVGGTLNASLRGEDGTIYGNSSIGSYVDTSVNTIENAFTGRMTFDTYLDPNLPTGVWSFQFRWYNATHAGAVAIPFKVIPVTDVQIVTPSGQSFDVLEGDLVSIEVITLDFSHNSSWGLPGNVNWEVENRTLVSQGFYSDNLHYLYSTTLNTSIGHLNTIRPKTYVINASFTEGPHTDFDTITMNIYYRGSATATGISDIEAGSTVSLDFIPINETGGGTLLNSSSITFDLDYPFTSTYIPSTGHYRIDIPWSPDFSIGANTINIRWTLADFREIASNPTITSIGSFNVIDTSSPIFNSSPGSVSISEGTTGNTLSWNATDPFPDRYEIFRNGTAVDTGTWADNSLITVNIDGLASGVYNFTILVNDTEGNSNTNEATVTVTDDLAPAVIETIAPSIVAEDSTGNQIQWNLTDVHPNQYTIYRNGSAVQSGSWDNPSYITVPVSSSVNGVYNFTLAANDTSGNQITTSVFITVTDLTVPIITSQPNTPVSYNEGSTGNLLTWTATDKHAGTAQLFRNGTAIASQSWTSGAPNSFNVDGLSLGVYNFTVVFTDQYGNAVSHQVILTVTDGTSPVFISTPNNQTIFAGESGNSINWTVSDAHPASFSIYQNGSVVLTGGWTSGTPIVIGLSGLALGIHNYSILITDVGGNRVTNTVFITVRGSSIPQFSSEPNDITYAEGSTGNTLQWVATAQFPATYTVFRNGSVYSSGAWQSDIAISVNVDGLSKGIYNFTIEIVDQEGKTITSTVFVIVEDITPPVGETVFNTVTLREGASNSLNWTVSDLYPLSYQLLVNGTLILSGAWSSNVPLVIDFPYPKGIYNVTAVFTDESGNKAVFSTIVDVKDLDAPQLISQSPTSPASIDEQNLPASLQWLFEDRHPDEYSIYINSSIFATGSWINDTPISIVLADLVPGSYNITIVVTDESGNQLTIQSDLLIIDTTPPTFVNEPNPYRYFLGDTGNTLTWVIDEKFPGIFVVKKNGTDYLDGTWNNTLTIDIDGLPLGVHLFELTVFDTSGNSAVSSVMIVVKDPAITETAPVDIEVTPNVFEGAIETIDGTWNTLSGSAIANATITVSLLAVNVSTLQTHSIFTTSTFMTSANGSFTILLNYTDAPEGAYRWIITFSKYQHENITQVYDVVVQPHHLMVKIEALGELVRDRPYAISVSVFYNDSVPQGGLVLQALTLRSGRASGVNVSVQISLVFLDGTETTIQRFGITGTTGVATVILTRDETRLIDRIVSISASIPSSPFYQTTSSVLAPESLPYVRSQAAGAFERLFLQFSTDIRYSLALFALILIFLGMVGLISFIRKKRRAWIEMITKESMYALDEIEAIMSIKAIVLKNTGSGIPYYEQIFTDMGTPIELISGLSSALTSFLDEVSQPGGFGVEILERSGLSLTSHRAEKSTLTIISEQPLPDSLISKASKGHISLHARISHMLDDPIRMQSIPPELVEREFMAAGFNIHLKDRLTINRTEVSKIKNKSSLSRTIRKTILLLQEFPEETATLEEIFSYLKQQQKNEEIAAKAIVFANAFKIIERTL
ncbi:MAG: hypothetical protein D6732_18575 [Methanobacteriota archaeon]|nr:MAG: hypothetical protein D6732_18575 [Euryarchaeota archaeon]